MGFIESKMIDELPEHGQVLDRQVFELYSAAPGDDLFPSACRDFLIVYNSALNPIQVNESVVFTEYF
ncbi:MAG: hypothetical protein WB930_02720, partial [Syntrophobacteraceae bacterium]